MVLLYVVQFKSSKSEIGIATQGGLPDELGFECGQCVQTLVVVHNHHGCWSVGWVARKGWSELYECR